MGLAGFPGPCHRVLRQERAARAATPTPRARISSRTMVISCFSFTEVRQARRHADAEWRRDGDAHLQRRRRARCRTTTSWAWPRPRSKPRCAISRSISARSRFASTPSRPGPIRTLAGAGITDARQMFAFQQRHSPLGRGVTLDELGGAGALSALRSVDRRHRRHPFRRFRLQRHRHAASGCAQGGDDEAAVQAQAVKDAAQ